MRAVKDQYFGDVNDYRKYALLRALLRGARTTATVCWMLTPDDGRTDGRHTGYLSDADTWRRYDPELFDFLRASVADGPRPGVGAIERSGLLTGCRYVPGYLGDAAPDREAYFARTRAISSGTRLVFFDPDNGMEVPSVRYGRARSAKYLFWRELEATHAAGRSSLVFQYYPRVDRDRFDASLAARMRAATGAGCVHVFRSAWVGFFLAPHARDAAALTEGARATARALRHQLRWCVHGADGRSA